MQRWTNEGHIVDLRKGSQHVSERNLTAEEEQRIVDICCSPEFVDMPPRQIYVRLLDRGEYVGSISSMYKILNKHNLIKHRGTRKPPTFTRPNEVEITRPKQQWCWDISYLRTPVAGRFYYLYIFMDVYSRKIVGWDVYEKEDGVLARRIMERALLNEGVNTLMSPLALHQDNGAPMKSSEFTSLLKSMGIETTYSRPRHSNDNPFSESLFSTVKGRVTYPKRGFVTLQDARLYVAHFVHWYNEEHMHVGLDLMAPAWVHDGKDKRIAETRNRTYADIRHGLPAIRWNRGVKVWGGAKPVTMHARTRYDERVGSMPQTCGSKN